MKKEKLQELLRLHEVWLDDGEGGEYADLRGADLRGADLMSADLKGANLIDTILMDASLKGSDLRNAILKGANLMDADLRNTILMDANLSNANLRNANLKGADLSNADLQNANLSNASLKGVDMMGAKNIMSFQAGNSNRICYAVKHDDCVMFKIGCFWGNTEEAIKKIRGDEKYGEGHHYEKLVLIYAEILGE